MTMDDNDHDGGQTTEDADKGLSTEPSALLAGEEPAASELPVMVGIAASAGGLEAATILVQNLPVDVGAAYVLAQHMSPNHKSLLSSLISRETDMPVIDLTRDDIRPEPNTIYIGQPNADVVLENGLLGLRPQSGHHAKPKPSADRLFNSLAAEMGERCVGLVLSGTGSDGSYGVQAIREAGGITISQDVGTAKYDGMPSSAVETGCVDLQLSPQQIGQHLAKILSAPRDLDRFRRLNDEPSPLSDLMHILLARTGVDFRDYKENTVNRRIARRMTALGIDSYDDYVEHCRTSSDEVDALHKDLLISVTRFFRDGDQFEILEKVIQKIADNKGEDPIRVWVAGCATGEEAYSIAILIAEALGGPPALAKARVQVFATDIDARALEVGRAGIYPMTALGDVPEKYIDQYFRSADGRVEVIPALRQMVLFSHHNIFQDPPFINVDLVSLRNVMIYFKSALQEKVLARLYYALASGGMLFLGTSEAIGAMHAYFETSDFGDKIYVKRTLGRRGFDSSTHSAFSTLPLTSRSSGLSQPAANRNAEVQESSAMFESLARVVAPNGFVVTRRNDIIRIFGDISSITEFSERSNLSLTTAILRQGLRDEAASLTPLTLRSREARRGRWHALPGPDHDEVQLEAYPMLSSNNGEPHVLFAVRTRKQSTPTPELSELTNEERLAYVQEIELEMASTREALQQTVEELQTANEELQSVNEEMQSTNEELQATNEELETSNEELQSTNEELITVNEEMQINATELQTLTTEMVAILDNVPLPTLVIDHALQIRRASRAARDLFDINSLTAAGVHLSQCRLPSGVPSLTSLVSDVFRKREELSLQADGKGMLREIRVTPFYRSNDELLGVTLVVNQFDTRGMEAMLGLMDDIGGLSHWRLDVRSKQLYWSRDVYTIHGLDEENGPPPLDDALGFYVEEDRDRISAAVEAAMTDGTPYSIRAKIIRTDGEIIDVAADGVGVRGDDGVVGAVVGVFRQLDK